MTLQAFGLVCRGNNYGGIGLYENAPTFVNREALPAKAKFVWITV